VHFNTNASPSGRDFTYPSVIVNVCSLLVKIFQSSQSWLGDVNAERLDM